MTSPKKERPIPPHLDLIVLGYEADEKIWLDREAFLQRSAKEVEVFLRSRGFFERVIPRPLGGPDGCFLLRRMESDKPPLTEKVQKLRRLIAVHIGVRPAAFYIFIPEFANELVGDPEDGITFARKYRFIPVVLVLV